MWKQSQISKTRDILVQTHTYRFCDPQQNAVWSLKITPLLAAWIALFVIPGMSST